MCIPIDSLSNSCRSVLLLLLLLDPHASVLPFKLDAQYSPSPSPSLQSFSPTVVPQNVSGIIAHKWHTLLFTLHVMAIAYQVMAIVICGSSRVDSTRTNGMSCSFMSCVDVRTELVLYRTVLVWFSSVYSYVHADVAVRLLHVTFTVMFCAHKQLASRAGVSVRFESLAGQWYRLNTVLTACRVRASEQPVTDSASLILAWKVQYLYYYSHTSLHAMARPVFVRFPLYRRAPGPQKVTCITHKYSIASLPYSHLLLDSTRRAVPRFLMGMGMGNGGEPGPDTLS